MNEPGGFRDERTTFKSTPALLSRPPVVCKALALERVLRETQVMIGEDEFIVGSIASTNSLSHPVLPDQRKKTGQLLSFWRS